MFWDVLNTLHETNIAEDQWDWFRCDISCSGVPKLAVSFRECLNLHGWFSAENGLPGLKI